MWTVRATMQDRPHGTSAAILGVQYMPLSFDGGGHKQKHLYYRRLLRNNIFYMWMLISLISTLLQGL